jgi:hypothetical protein
MVERFSVNFPMMRMDHDDAGPLVSFSDYECLRAENARLTAEVNIQRESKEFAQRCCEKAEARAEAAEARADKAAEDMRERIAQYFLRRETTYNPGMSAVDVRLSYTEGYVWPDGPAIAAAIRSLPLEKSNG